MTIKLLAVSRYQKVVAEIVRITQEARKTQVEAYWQIGRRIVRVEQDGSIRARYGSGLLKVLSEDLSRSLGPGFSERNLTRMRGFYLSHPISPTSAKLSWSQHVELLPLGSKVKRLRLESRAVREGLTSHELRRLVHAETAHEQASKDGKPPELLKPAQGTLYTYRILEADSVQPGASVPLLIDLGFSCYRDLDVITSKAFKPGDIVQSVKTGEDAYKLQKSDQTKEALYTYKAAVERVVDGDTLRVVVDLGFNTRTRQYLKLRGIDAPELATPEGKRAADFVKARIRAASQIILTSSKSDKYDRYLADVFFTDSKGEEVYLNNSLLETGHAVRI